MKENNIIYYEGRTDSQVKVRGHHVDLKEIEIFISKYPIVHEGKRSLNSHNQLLL